MWHSRVCVSRACCGFCGRGLNMPLARRVDSRPARSRAALQSLASWITAASGDDASPRQRQHLLRDRDMIPVRPRARMCECVCRWDRRGTICCLLVVVVFCLACSVTCVHPSAGPSMSGRAWPVAQVLMHLLVAPFKGPCKEDGIYAASARAPPPQQQQRWQHLTARAHPHKCASRARRRCRCAVHAHGAVPGARGGRGPRCRERTRVPATAAADKGAPPQPPPPRSRAMPFLRSQLVASLICLTPTDILCLLLSR